MKNIIYLTTILLIISCSNKTETKILQKSKTEKLVIVDTLEFFADSINFGERQKNKIKVYKIGTEENTIAKVYLYEKRKNQWKLKDSLILEAVRINDLETEVKDFNNDNFKDIIFTTGMAARGGNIVQTLILYSPKTKSLNWIKNSESYPNLMYNKKLDCIDACILTGGQTTYFLKIEKDTLREFANVDQRDGRIIAEIRDPNGKWIEIENIKDEPESLDRFINFNPIEKRK
ncbi:hypothetical protein [Flavobacterium frigidimaris]|uniref:Lipoprotein n=1 Tax=Flavobacterium frigidimaris TaxID=262320 RepID=A0ABX4BJM4_FLAFR|nr:hypothetical protein [Flavobacterium frigidimaris]OXA75024.1 hypothetical protein B0A65_22750 [Flavobacterium frigidimaris]